MEEENPESGGSSRIAWHPAFVEALRLELEGYEDVLEIISEHPLTSEPLRIDVVIIKKAVDAVIDRNIAAIFRAVNILEYKSPGDYVSVADFYKVYGYACLYAALEGTPITGLTLTFVGSRHPGKLFAHLREERRCGIEERSPGIYSVTGDILPVQVIDSRKLPEEENLWMRNLGGSVDTAALGRIAVEIGRRGKAARTGAYLDAIARANVETVREAVRMSDSMAALEQVFEEVGWIAKWEARGMTKGVAQGVARGAAQTRREVAENLLANGFSAELAAKMTAMDIEEVRALRP
jgi:hypothetical protein